MKIGKDLRRIANLSLAGLITLGCGEKGPKAGDDVSLSGKVVGLFSFAPSGGFGSSIGGYPNTTRDLTIESNGRNYHISTTAPNTWKGIRMGDSVYLSGKYKYTPNFKDDKYKKDTIDVVYADLELIDQKNKH